MPGWADCQPHQELFGAELAGEGWCCASVCWETWSPRGSMSLQVPTPQNGTRRKSLKPTQAQPHLASPDLSHDGLSAVGRCRECFLRTRQHGMNSKTHPFLQKCSANPLMQMHPVCLSACTTGLLLVWLLCAKYFAELRIQRSQQTRNQSSKARARAGVIKARRVSTGEAERLLSPPCPTHYLFLLRHHQCWCSCATVSQKSLWIKSQRCSYLPPSHQGPVPSKSCDWCPRTWSHLLVPLEKNQWPWLQASGPASSWNQQGDRELCFLAVPPRCSWPVQQSDVEEEEEEEELPLVVPLLQASNGALSSFPLVPRSQSTEEAQWEAPPTLPLGKLHSPLLKHIFLRASVSGCHTAAPQWFCQKKKKREPLPI